VKVVLKPARSNPLESCVTGMDSEDYLSSRKVKVKLCQCISKYHNMKIYPVL